MADKTTLSAKFQISIPKAVRDAQEWRAGQELVLIPKGKGVLIMPVPTRDELRGLAKGANPEGYRSSLMRLVDTSAWIEWLVGSKIGDAVEVELPAR